jgi:hypothetical protein
MVHQYSRRDSRIRAAATISPLLEHIAKNFANAHFSMFSVNLESFSRNNGKHPHEVALHHAVIPWSGRIGDTASTETMEVYS